MSSTFAARVRERAKRLHSLALACGRDTGWQECIGCLKLQISFRIRAINYWALLRKMTCKDEAFDAFSPPSSAHAWTSDRKCDSRRHFSRAMSSASVVHERERALARAGANAN